MAFEWSFGAQPDEWVDDEEWFDENGNSHIGFESETTVDQVEFSPIDWFDEDGNYHIIN